MHCNATAVYLDFFMCCSLCGLLSNMPNLTFHASQRNSSVHRLLSHTMAMAPSFPSSMATRHTQNSLWVELESIIHCACKWMQVLLELMCPDSLRTQISNACRPNPYHNSTHAADVTQALLSIVYQDSLHTKFTDLELLACLIAAIIHDVVHPGFSNQFLTKTQDEQALMYNDQSANEALSLSVGFKILQSRECNLFKTMSREDYFYARKCVS
jgi:hypothetical protein